MFAGSSVLDGFELDSSAGQSFLGQGDACTSECMPHLGQDGLSRTKTQQTAGLLFGSEFIENGISAEDTLGSPF